MGDLAPDGKPSLLAASARVHPLPADPAAIPKPKSREAFLVPAEVSLLVFRRGNFFRELLLKVARSAWFERFILIVILANSVVLALTDYRHVDDSYTPVTEGSRRNAAIAASDPFFTWIFTFEAVAKIVGFGFKVYIGNPWNRLDFAVVVSALLGYIKGVPKVSMLRTFRVLRPLRAISKFPGLRRVIAAMLQSIRGLADVVLLLSFLMAVFSIMGVSFFSGLLHARCRVTPYPVKLGACVDAKDACWTEFLTNVSADPLPHACLLENGEPVANNDASWGRRSDSPWAQPQDCVWPFDESEDARICSELSGGFFHCHAWENRTCGGDFDSLGNPRFIRSGVPYEFDRRKAATYNADLQWGFGLFDNFGEALVTVFQVTTEEGWTNIMYKCMDAYNPVVAAIIFCLLILLGSFIVLNLILAVITESIHEADEFSARDRSYSRKVKALQLQLRLDEGGDDPGLPPPLRQRPPPLWRPACKRVMEDRLWQALLMGAIVANTVVLAMDRYPISDEQTARLETANVAFTAIFAVEFVVAVGALGWRKYCRSPFNLFDGLIVVTSLLDLVVEAASSGSQGHGMSALRTFRLLRVFKLARRWKSLQSVLSAMARTTLQIGNFAGLLGLFIYIYALIGMQFFANRLHFDPVTGVPLGITELGYDSAYIPRDNFDTMLWAMASVFQVLTRDNWNELLYLCWNAAGATAPIYFLSLMVIGSFVVMNTFLAILLSNFEGDESLSRVSSSGSIASAAKGLASGARARFFGGTSAILQKMQSASPAQALVDAQRLLGNKMVDAMAKVSSSGALSSLSRPNSPGTSRHARNPSSPSSVGTAAATPVGLGAAQTLEGLGSGLGASDVAAAPETKPAWPGEEQRRRLETAAAAAAGAAARAAAAAAAAADEAGVLPTRPAGGRSASPSGRAAPGDVLGSMEAGGVASFFPSSPSPERSSGQGGSPPARGRRRSRQGQMLGNSGSANTAGAAAGARSASPATAASSLKAGGLLRVSGNRGASGGAAGGENRTADDGGGSSSIDRNTGREASAAGLPKRTPPKLSRGFTSPELDRGSRAPSRLVGRGERSGASLDEEGDDEDGPSGGWGTARTERMRPHQEGGGSASGTPSKSRRGSAFQLRGPHVHDLVDIRRRLGEAQKTVAEHLKKDLGSSITQEESRSCWVLGENHPLRMLCKKIVTHRKFDTVVLYAIAASTILLAIDTPLRDPDSSGSQAIASLDLFFNIAFLCEALLKITAYGFLLHRGAYLRNSWNQLDFFLVTVGMLSVVSLANGGGLRILRTFRVLRPLRMVARNPELKVVVDALISAIPAIFNVSIVCTLFFLVFAVIAVTYLKGALNTCSGIDSLTAQQQDLITYPVSYAAINGTYGANATAWLAGSGCDASLNALSLAVPTSRELCECIVGDGAWSAAIDQSFDNSFKAMGTLYEMTTTEGWFGIMTAAVDQRGIDMQPVENSSLVWVFFFVGFMIFGAFFIMNLFVGVVIDNFNTIKAAKGTVFMTKEQEEWQKMQRIVMKIRPKRVHKPPRARWRRVCYDVMMLRYFDSFIVACICGNSVVMALQHFGETYTFQQALAHLNSAFAVVFLLEAVIKIVAIGKLYFLDSWNRFDFVIVVGTLVGQIVSLVVGSSVGTVAAIVRIFRLGRILRLINRAKSLRQLFNTLVTSLPSFANIGGLLFLLFFMYAVLGIQLFAKVGPEGELNDHANFYNIWMALLTLFRCSTGENWNSLMYNLASGPADCEASQTYPTGGRKWCQVSEGPDCVQINGCGTSAAYPFFYSFTLVVTFVMLNLFIGVILDSFSSCDEGDNVLTPQHFDIFVEDWAKFDPDGTCFMHVEDLPDFIQILDAPMGFGEEYEATSEEVQRRILELRIKVRDEAGNRVHFTDVAAALAKRVAIEKFGGLIDGADSEKEEEDAAAAREAAAAAAAGGGVLKRVDSRFRAGLQQGLRADLNRQNDFDAEELVEGYQSRSVSAAAVSGSADAARNSGVSELSVSASVAAVAAGETGAQAIGGSNALGPPPQECATPLKRKKHRVVPLSDQDDHAVEVECATPGSARPLLGDVTPTTSPTRDGYGWGT